MHLPPPPDWQLPPGVNRGLWDYLHDPDLARNYDASLAGSSLFSLDLDFVQRHCPQPGRLVDLGCGTGRLLIPLARQGYRVVGVDLSEPMLTVAAAKAHAAGVAIDLLRGNLTQLDTLADQSFDHAACLFSTLGMVLGAENRRTAIAQVRRLLRPGGCFVLHVHNRWFNFWDRAGRRWLVKDWLRSWTGVDSGDRTMPPHQGIAGLTLHHFTRREVLRYSRTRAFASSKFGPSACGWTANCAGRGASAGCVLTGTWSPP